MIQHGERTAARTQGRSRAWLRSKYILLRDEVAVGSSDLARIGLIGCALVLQTIVIHSPGHFRPAGDAFFALAVPLGTLLSLAFCVAATLPLRRVLGVRARQLLAAAALAMMAILPVFGVAHGIPGIGQVMQNVPPSNDGAVMDLNAAEQVRHGHDPYMKTNIVAALARVNAPSTTTTPLMNGQFRGALSYPSAAAVETVFYNVLRKRPHTIPPEFESKYNYPAGSFLFILPFVSLGIHDMRFLYALAVLGMGVYLWFRLPRHLRLLAPFLVLSDVPLLASTAGGQPDPLYGLFLMVALAEWRSPKTSAVSMGVAVATKQLAWFFLPFYLVLIARRLGWRDAAARSGLVAVIFLVVNGPFIIQSPHSYVVSLAAPMADPMFPLGVGIIALFVSNVVPMAPKFAFTLAEVGVWAGTLLTYFRSRRLPPAAGVVLAALPLFFAWRSLTTYFYLIPLLTLAATFAPGEPVAAPIPDR